MCMIKIMIKYGTRDIIKDAKITAIMVEISGSLMKKILIKNMTAAKAIYNLI
ncbi:hypothetical protein SDC9_98050 [bioreactor metagenome]|uniref:Uncharacterized protein n=1 Tax=bioreactor metagenome TaxID=1076179 RepID=A0A645ADL5_9ZZZZ